MTMAPGFGHALDTVGVHEGNVIAATVDTTYADGHRHEIYRFTALGHYDTPGRRLPEGPDEFPTTRFEVVHIDDGPYVPHDPER